MVWVNREVIVLHDVTDSVFFSLVFVLLQVVCVQLYMNLMAACLCWVV